MISSMTGYGCAEYEDDEKSIHVEIKTVNNRFLKIKTKTPEFMNAYEHEIEKRVKQSIKRGSVYISINYQKTTNEPICNINFENLKHYYQMLQCTKEEINYKNDITLDTLITLPGIIEKPKNSDINLEEYVNATYDLLSDSLKDLVQMRIRAGKDIMGEVIDKGERIKVLLKKVEDRTPTMMTNYCKRLQERVATLTKDINVSVTEDDLCKEIAIYADRSDITEEIKLLRSHIDQLNETMENGGHVGKKAEFIIQEMFRESNTMGSKTNDEIMLSHIFDIKNEIEKIKELALNIE